MSELQQSAWSLKAAEWQFAYGRPVCHGAVKNKPEDFCVIEQMDIAPSGEGEHIWLRVRKCKQNTDQVAKQIARFAKVAYRDVGYSGLKDYFAITEQWFSVWMPKGGEPDWRQFALPGVVILESTKHSRKIKRGTHSANRFVIIVEALPSFSSSAKQPLAERLEVIKTHGVPNYFGLQRFGRNVNNMPQAQQMLSGAKRIKDRNLRSILLSSARSWMFNEIVSARIENASWQNLHKGEPANLDGSGSVFRAAGTDSEELDSSLEITRLAAMDIHPTAPMWGEYGAKDVTAYQDLHQFELSIVKPYAELMDGLLAARVAYQRRPIRMRVMDLDWQIEKDKVSLGFTLRKGQFATSVLRELIVAP